MYNPQMADSPPARVSVPRHALLVRTTHWISVAAFAALLITGIEILISHPRFYWAKRATSG